MLDGALHQGLARQEKACVNKLHHFYKAVRIAAAT
jgi:hypothetical protein